MNTENMPHHKIYVTRLDGTVSSLTMTGWKGAGSHRANFRLPNGETLYAYKAMGEWHEMVMFEIFGLEHHADKETLDTLLSVIPSAKESGDLSAVIAIMELGKLTGRIEMTETFYPYEDPTGNNPQTR